MRDSEIKEAAESIACNAWERGGGLDIEETWLSVDGAVRKAFAGEGREACDEALRYARAWLDEADAVPDEAAEPAHTPLPWAAEESRRPWRGELAKIVSINHDMHDGLYRHVADLLPAWGKDAEAPAEVAANARLIVTAVNHHADLVSCLRDLIGAVGVRIDDPRIGLFDRARALLAEIEMEGE